MAYLGDNIPRKSAKLVITDQVTSLIRDLTYTQPGQLFNLVSDNFKIGDESITCATMEVHVKRMHLQAYSVIASTMLWTDLKLRIDRALNGG